MNKRDKRKRCKGCDDNFYNNGGVNGNTEECWNLENAEPCIKKEVHVSDRPPWENQLVKKVLDCYHKSKYVYVDPERKR